jgi:NAD-dependent SIR2 family protein deacetylase
MAKTLNKFADYSPGQIDALVEAMKSVIVKTIENKLLLSPITPPFFAPDPYGRFANLIEALRNEAEPRQTVAVISFNYDMALESAFYLKGIQIDYGLGEQGDGEGVPVLKLHGSVNWAYCKGCKRIVPWDLDSYLEKFPIRARGFGKKVSLPIGSSISEYKHCEGADVEPEPVLVPPTWNKGEYHGVLSSVWRRAAEELGEAQSIFVIGYSLPLSDYFFRHLYALGSVGKGTIRRFWVVNPDVEVGLRFRELLGLEAQERFSLLSEEKGLFNNAIDPIAREFDISTPVRSVVTPD